MKNEDAISQTIEICPSCGKLTDKLGEYTGFCSKCSVHVGGCANCGASANGGGHHLCKKCRRNEWLTINADDIESHMAFGLTFKKAQSLIRRMNEEKINCLACGDFVRDPRTFFCNRTLQCKQAHNKLKYLLYYKGLSRPLALKTVLEGLL